MQFTFFSNIIDNFSCWLYNKSEELSHWWWNKKPQSIKCKICGNVLKSNCNNSPSPMECGWKRIKHSSQWICHRCDAHRIFAPYIKLTDLDEEMNWADLKLETDRYYEAKNRKNKILKSMLKK